MLLTAPVKEIYFSGVAPQNNKAFGLICNERKAGTMTCHMFLTTGPASFLEQGVNKAFEAATQLQVDPLAIRRRHMNTPEAVATGFDKVQLTRENLLVRLIIGQGQFGQVFLAEYTAPGKTAADMKEVAVKLMRADASHVDAEEFLAEAHTLMQFDHPRCIGVSGDGVVQGKGRGKELTRDCGENRLLTFPLTLAHLSFIFSFVFYFWSLFVS